MKKKNLTLLLLLLTSSAYSMQPYTAPDLERDWWLYEMNGYIGLSCPNCKEHRLFPDMDFVLERIKSLTEEQKIYMFYAVCDYTGDIVAGRMCPFCGLKIYKPEISIDIE